MSQLPSRALRIPRWIVRTVDWYSIAAYRISNGRWGSRTMGLPILLLTTIGRKSRKLRTHALLYGSDGRNLVLVGSYGGAEQHPGWFHNLRARPHVLVQIGARREERRARIVDGAEYARLWAEMLKLWPTYTNYQAATQRSIPIVVLEPLD